jgi:hypothetical protein
MKCKKLAILILFSIFSTAALPAWAGPKPPIPLPPFFLPPIPDLRHLVPVPKTGAYFVPDVAPDLLFFDGFWWTQREGHWYHAQDYHREFVPVPPAYVPAPLLHLRPDYRDHYRNERRVPYGEWRKKHWRKEWDRERHGEWEHRGGEGQGDRGKHGGQDHDKHGGRD